MFLSIFHVEFALKKKKTYPKQVFGGVRTVDTSVYLLCTVRRFGKLMFRKPKSFVKTRRKFRGRKLKREGACAVGPPRRDVRRLTEFVSAPLHTTAAGRVWRAWAVSEKNPQVLRNVFFYVSIEFCRVQFDCRPTFRF